MDESGSFFRRGPNRSYLSAFESRSQVRGTEFGNYKDRVTILLSCNADGSHGKPVTYIGSAKNPSYFRSNRYNLFKTKYRSQENGWIVSNGFKNWIKWWYTEIRKKSNGPWLLVMDNCGGHESEIALSRLRIELLLPRSTAKYQSLDIGLISHSKIRYRSNFLRASINVMLER